jgi:hypothetical protein
MVSPIIRLLAAEAAVSAANAFNGNKLIRIYNPNATDVLITITNASAAVVGTVTVRTGETIFINKAGTDTVTAATACRMVPVAF